VYSKTTHPLTIIDFTGYGPSGAGGHRSFPLRRLRDGAGWAAVCSCVGRAGLASHVVSVAPRLAACVQSWGARALLSRAIDNKAAWERCSGKAPPSAADGGHGTSAGVGATGSE